MSAGSSTERPLWVLVPAYEPDHRLVDLVAALAARLPLARVLVVDDGSGEAYAEPFGLVAAAGGVVVQHARNYGKAEALRTGMAAILERAPGADIVCVDCDGQHLPRDVARVADELARLRALGAAPGLVLGCRSFDGAVPLRSRVGNRATTALVELATGQRIDDTQTGLRGIPAELVPWLLAIPG
ncbi:MAG: glycosyltransferase family 2 protein, partial [Salana multivorans]|nr:glycosyltransferase family 2 protein [Salana multivorans]